MRLCLVGEYDVKGGIKCGIWHGVGKAMRGDFRNDMIWMRDDFCKHALVDSFKPFLKSHRVVSHCGSVGLFKARSLILNPACVKLFFMPT